MKVVGLRVRLRRDGLICGASRVRLVPGSRLFRASRTVSTTALKDESLNSILQSNVTFKDVFTVGSALRDPQENFAGPRNPRTNDLVDESRPINRSRLEGYKGTRIWHRMYTLPRAKFAQSEYTDTFRMLRFCGERTAKTHISRARRCLAQSKTEEALAHWNELFAYMRTRMDECTSGAECPPEGPLLPDIFLKFVLKLPTLDQPTFDLFWKPLVSSPLIVEVIPCIMANFCQHHKPQIATNLLHHIDNHLYTKLYEMGLNYGLNVILAYYSGRCDENGVSKYWSEMYDVIHGLNPDIKLVLIRQISWLLHVRVPRYAYGDFYKLLLARKANLSDPSFNSFIKAFFASSDAGRQLVVNTDEVVVGSNNLDRPDVSTSFSLAVYDYLLKRLSLEKDTQKTAWLLENIILKRAKTGQQLEGALRVLLRRAIETDGIATAGVVYESILSRGIEPDTDMFRTLLRGFRIHGQEAKCYEVLDRINRQGFKLDDGLCVELLSLICSLYNPAVVVEFYNIMYPEHRKYVDSLGINEFLKSNEFDCYDRPRYTLTEEQVATCDVLHGPALAIVYKSVLANAASVEEVTRLYEKYCQVFGSTQITLSIVDWFVVTLCKFMSRQAVEAAYGLFIDALTKFRFHRSARKHKPCKSLGALSKAYCLPTQPSSLHCHVDKAIELVYLTEKYSFLPVTGSLLAPIVKYFLRKGDLTEADQWIDFAKSSGALIRSEEVVRRMRERCKSP
jgi:hypothetical protein